MSQMLERIESGSSLIALIIRAGYHGEGIEFFTPGEASQQLAYMNRPVGHHVKPHVHNRVQREVTYTQEVLFVRKGKIKVNLYDEHYKFIDSRILETGDLILLVSGGHGLEMLEQSELIEIKQGPYAGDHDKTHFTPRD